MDIFGLLISLISGAVGGNIAGALIKKYNLGTVGNSIAGILGGGVGSWILQAFGFLGAGGAGLSLGAIVGNVASGGVGGAILLVVFGMIKGARAKQ